MIHKQSKSLLIVALPIILALFSLGCNLSGLLAEEQAAAELQFSPTRTPLPTFTPTPEGAGFIQVATLEPLPTLNEAVPMAPESTTGSGQTEASQEVVPTETPTLVVPPTDTPIPQPTDTPTPSVPMVTVKQNMNVRGGPGTNYPVIGSGSSGDTTKITGRNQDGSWVQVEYPSDDGRGWLYAPLVDVSGDVSTMPVAQASMDPLPPPPEIAAPSEPPPAEQAAAPAPPPKQYQFTPDAWHASENAGIVHFKGRIKDEHGNLINGFSVLLDNWSWKVLSHPSGASHWYPEKGPGEWDVVMPKLSTAQGWWWLSVVSYDCDFMGGFDSKCPNYTQLSEEVKIQVQSPDESIINANWICHWDCDKGVYFHSYTKDWGYGAPQ